MGILSRAIAYVRGTPPYKQTPAALFCEEFEAGGAKNTQRGELYDLAHNEIQLVGHVREIYGRHVETTVICVLLGEITHFTLPTSPPTRMSDEEISSIRVLAKYYGVRLPI